MKHKRYIRLWIKQGIICIFIITLFNALNSIRVSAENNVYIIGGGEEVYNYQDLLNRYEINSPAYNRNSLTYQIEALNGTISSETYDGYSNQWAGISQTITELNSTREELIAYKNLILAQEDADNTILLEEIDDQIAEVDAQIEMYSSSMNSVKENTAEAKLQKEISSFYSIYQQELIRKGQRLLKNDFLKSCYALIINKEQIDYYNSYQEYLDTAYEVETIKYKKGVSTQEKVNNASIDIQQNETSKLKYQNSYDTTLKSIQTETGISKNVALRFDMSFYEKNYDEDQTFYQFINCDTDYMQLLSLVACYQNYLGLDGMTSDAVYKQVGLQIQDYQLQIEELTNNIKTYVGVAIRSYHSAFRAKETAQNILSAKEENCRIVKAMLDNKKATILELKKAYVDKESAEITYYQCCYEIIVWENIIENGLYGASP